MLCPENACALVKGLSGTCDDGQAAVVSQVDVIWDEHARPSCCLHARMPQSLHKCYARVDIMKDGLNVNALQAAEDVIPSTPHRGMESRETISRRFAKRAPNHSSG